MPLGANKAAIMGVAGVSTGDVVLLSSQTADGDSAISFTSGITSTYGEYIFRLYNINPATDAKNFTFQVSTDGGSNYNVSLVNTYFNAYHSEDDSSTSLGYSTSMDQVGTAFQSLMEDIGSGADESGAGELHLFNPSSTTYVKHWYGRFSHYYDANYAIDTFPAGYFNTTSAINAVQFKSESGNFDGTIKMWGVK
jgi:hypothetical protein